MRNLIASMLTRTFATADKYDVDLPHRAELEKQLDFIKTVDNWAPADTVPLNKAIVLALAADRDPLDDKDVQRAFIAQGMREGGISRTDEALGILSTAVVEASDDMIGAFKPVYDAAGARFTAAHKSLTRAGITNLDQAGASQGSFDLAKANIDARETDTITRETADAVAVLMFSATGTPIDADRFANVFYRFDIADTPVDQIARNGNGGKLSNWQAASQGYTFSLATRAEMQQRRQHATQQQLQRQSAQDERQRDAFRSFPPVVVK